MPAAYASLGSAVRMTRYHQDVSDWVKAASVASGVAAVAALAITAVQLWARAREGVRSQASLVTLWVEQEYNHAARGPTTKGPACLAMLNAGEHLIRGVLVQIKWSGGLANGPGDGLLVHVSQFLPPGVEPIKTRIDERSESYTSFDFNEGSIVEARMLFRDARNRLWLRDWDGSLRRYDSLLRKAYRRVQAAGKWTLTRGRWSWARLSLEANRRKRLRDRSLNRSLNHSLRNFNRVKRG
jgi:hypothetical protein